MDTKIRAFACPPKYIQGPGVLRQLETYTRDLGKAIFAIITPSFYNQVSGDLQNMYQKAGATAVCEKFGGETSMVELGRLTALAAGKGYDVVVGIGGGKAMDAAKYVGIQIEAAIVTVPTIVSTDAPTSALTATYTESGEHAGSIYYKRNPDLVLVDSEIIAKSPVRLFVSGMGDALSTYFEAKAHVDSNTKNRVGDGYQTPLAAMALSELCYTRLMADGVQAKADVEAGQLTEAVENIIEVNTLLSGIGVESAGCAGAHSLNAGFSALPGCQNSTHGEIVAFGTLCQLVLEDWPRETIEEVLTFSNTLGLPITLAEIGLSSEDTHSLMQAARKACTTKHIVAETVPTSPEILVEAVLQADAVGRAWKRA
ncbi:glycerol dehydrogenase [Eubacterium barkeri]|uniref:Glycerol dehydrogenase n=1 Tax=Eubacterium barkeri TaxID=1528 RepID=A0A1H3DRR9_EUBBA|nr:glycerol dehydrogenase [Eubacterium barkeri]SDX68808.1 glycerol dehydrogenase [Eubacterium barkeri]